MELQIQISHLNQGWRDIVQWVEYSLRVGGPSLIPEHIQKQPLITEPRVAPEHYRVWVPFAPPPKYCWFI